MRAITVLGAGVSGLTTAVRLIEAGFPVRILAKEPPEKTTSAVAAAIWFPYEAEPAAKVNRWSAESFGVFSELARQPGAGVRMTDFLVLTRPGPDNSWKDGLPAGTVREARVEELPPGYEMGYMANVPLAETQAYLPYLLKRFLDGGGEVQIREVKAVGPLLQEGHIVVNCTGLGARELFGDETVYPIRGQVVKVQKNGPAQSMVDSMVKGSLAYIIERSNCIVLGGTDYDNDYNRQPSEEDTQTILARCRQLEQRLGAPVVIQALAGLRPKRPAIRCEKEEGRNVFHNYGHGGAGFTVSWGCADEIRAAIILIARP
ncbi:MAG: FAD-binding oxidoreductase [Phaeodactylibacter sp.]|nr:FAD-binding oxidoreductase [Phaeodactylibacter sp.]